MRDAGDDDERVFAHVKAHAIRIADGEARRRNHTLTPRIANAIGELAHAFARELARDVRAYANHASRDVVDGTDVALRARKINPRLRHAREDVVAAVANGADDADDALE